MWLFLRRVYFSVRVRVLSVRDCGLISDPASRIALKRGTRYARVSADATTRSVEVWRSLFCPGSDRVELA
jgi:hypothetical protein